MATSFDDFLKKREQEAGVGRSRIVARTAVAANPDQAAQADQLARRYQMPPSAVEHDFAGIHQRRLADDAGATLATAPRTANWFARREQNARKSHDDLGPLAALENLLSTSALTAPITIARSLSQSIIDRVTSPGYTRGFSKDATAGNAGRALAGSATRFSTGVWGAAQSYLELQREFDLTAGLQKRVFGATMYDALIGETGRARKTAQSAGDRLRPNYQSQLGRDIGSGLESVGTSAAAAGTTIVTRNPLAGAAVLGLPVYGESYGRARDEGLSVSQSAAFGGIDAAVELGTEYVGQKFLLGEVDAASPFLKRFVKSQLFGEIPGEQAATLLQDLNQWAQIDVNKGKTFQDYLNERPDAALSTLVSTVVTGGSIAAVTGAIEKVANRAQPRITAAENVAPTQEFLEQLIQLAAASKVRERDVDSFEGLIGELTEDGPIEDLYIDARTLADTLEQSGFDPSTVPSITEQIEEALAVGGDVRIPVSEFTARLATDEQIGKALLPHLRLSPDDMSQAEAETFYQEAPEEMRTAVEQQLNRDETDEEWRASTDRVKQRVMAELTTANRFTRDVNDAYATMMANFFAVMGNRVGQTPEAMADRYGLQVRNERPTAAREATLGSGETAQATQPPMAALPKNSPGSFAPAREAATAYAERSGLSYRAPRTYAKVDKDRAARIAQAFEEMEHAPNDPEVKAAYDAMISETLAQWEEIKKTGLQVEFIEGADPYTSPWDAIRDVRDNNHLWVFPTDTGFGEGVDQYPDNPLLAMTDEVISGKPARVNDIFRIVHDYFGHIKEGVGFRADGEENAWRAHSAMYSPLARRAMTTETRGQNSWVNFGPNGESNRTASSENTVYAPQKIGLLPQWVVEEGAIEEDELSQPSVVSATAVRYILNNSTGVKDMYLAADGSLLVEMEETEVKDWKAKQVQSAADYATRALASPPVTIVGLGDPALKGRPLAFIKEPPVENGKVKLQHWSLAPDITVSDPNRWGANSKFLPAGERERVGVAPGRTYFGIATGTPGGYIGEFAGPPTHTAEIELSRLYDWNGNPNGFSSARKGGTLYEQAIRDAGFAGYWVQDPSIGLTAAVFEPVPLERTGETVELELAQTPIFYSALARAVDQSKTTKAPAAQWRATLQNAPGVKAEELEWSGLLDFLDMAEAAGETLTRQQLADAIEAGGIKVDEVVLGDERFDENEWIDARVDELMSENEVFVEDYDAPAMPEEADGVWVFNGEEYETEDDAMSDWEEADSEALREAEIGVADAQWDQARLQAEREWKNLDQTNTQFQDWSSDPENETYRELLITLPIGEGGNPDRAPDTHWDQPAVVAHVRFMEKRDTEGKRVLFVEEVQSDWHQKGRDQGYEETPTPERIEEIRQASIAASARVDEAREAVVNHYTTAVGRPPTGENYSLQIRDASQALGSDHPLVQELRAAELAELEAGRTQNKRGIPDAPFRTSWPTLVMKRAIRWAVDNGYERIAWTTGAQQAERYNLSQQLGKLTVESLGDGEYGVRSARVDLVNVVPDDQKRNGFGGGVIMTAAQIREVFGSDLGARMVEQSDGNRFVDTDGEMSSEPVDFQEEGLALGGEGMKAFYDRNLVNITNNLIKKTGAKVGPVLIKDGSEIVDTSEDETLNEIRARAQAFRNGMIAPINSIRRSIRETDPELSRDEEDRVVRSDPRYLELEKQWQAFRQEEQERKAVVIAELNAARANPGFDITPKLVEQARGGFSLFQNPPGWESAPGLPADAYQPSGFSRGTVTFASDITAQPTVIALLRNADLSTFLHESGHFFFEVLSDLAADPNSPAQVRQDMQTMLDYVGVSDLATWKTMSLGQRRDGHERVARSFEAYLFEGRAPNTELRSLFRRFRAWLVSIYRDIRALNVELTDEVRGVFDRMVATDELIAEAQAEAGTTATFETKPESMTDDQWEAFRASATGATLAAIERLQARSLQDMKWLAKAQSRELRKLQRQVEERRKEARAEVEAEVTQRPLFRAIEFLRRGTINGVEQEGTTKLSIAAVDALYEGDERLAEIKRKLGYGKFGMLAADGIDPQGVAELFGFTSPDHLIQDLAAAPAMKDVVDAEVDQRLLERYGDITSPEAQAAAVSEALHNDARGRFVATELAALANGAASPAADSRALQAAMTGVTSRVSAATSNPRVLSAAARRYAEAMIARLKVRAIRPAQYEAAERKAARAAMQAAIKADMETATTEKRNQLVNFYATRAARRAQDEVEKALDYLRKFDREGVRKGLDVEYLEQIDDLTERYDLRPSVTDKALRKRRSLLQWVEAQQERGFEPAVDEALLDEARRVHYRDMTLEELRGLIDTIRNIEHLGRLKKRLLTAKDKREFGEAATELADTISENAYRTVPEIIGTPSRFEVIKGFGSRFLAMHRKFASFVREMDGFKDGGAVWERLVRPMNEAADREAVMTEEATIALSALFKPLRSQKLNKREFIPEIGKSLSLQDRLVIAMNQGNETNQLRILEGDKWTPAQVDAILAPLTTEHWQFVQSIWDYIDSYWPQIAAKERRVTGVEPEKVEAVAINVKPSDGETLSLRGGYFPIKYDPDRSTRSESDTAAEVQRQMERGLYARAQTRRGHIKERVATVKRPVRKDFGVIFQHVTQVIHDLSWHEYLIDANRLLNDARVDGAIREGWGAPANRAMRDTLKDIAIGDVGAQNVFEQSINHLRTGATIAGLGWNLLTSLLQPLGLTQSMARIGPKWVARGVARVFRDAGSLDLTTTWVYERSDFMRLRAKTMQREISELRNQVSGKSGVRLAVEGSYFTLIVKCQLMADVPTWVGQFEKSMAAGETEERAAALADQAVLDSQGGGQIKDLAGIQRGGPLLKLWTNFYSYFNVTYNLMAQSTNKAKSVGPGGLPYLAADFLMLAVLPSVLTTFMRVALTGSDDDWDEDALAERLAKDQMSYLLGLMIGLREIGTAFGLNPNYSGPAGARVFGEAVKLGTQVQQGEADEAAVKAANNVAGILFHYPAGQVNRTVEGAIAVGNGDANPTALVVGPPRE